MLLWPLLLLRIFAVAEGVKAVGCLGRGASAAEKVRVKVRIVPESPGPLPPVGVRGQRPWWRPRELSLARPLSPGRGGDTSSSGGEAPLLLVIVGELPRLSPPSNLFRIPAEAKLSDIRKADLVEKSQVLLGKTIVHRLV